MEYKHNPPSLGELRAKRGPMRHPHREVKDNFTIFEHLAVRVTRGVGTLGFFFLLAFWTLGWLIWNIYAPAHTRFDPAPAFVVWLIISNIIQLVLLPLIMVGQNLEGKFSEQRAQADYEVNQKAEQEIEVIIAHLENQNELLNHLIEKLGSKDKSS